MNVVNILAFIRPELSLVWQGRKKYSKTCSFQNVQVLWLYCHGFACTRCGKGVWKAEHSWKQMQQEGRVLNIHREETVEPTYPEATTVRYGVHTHTVSVVRSLQFAVGTLLLKTAGHNESRDSAGWMGKLGTFWIDLCCLFPHQSHGNVWCSVQSGWEFRWREHLFAVPFRVLFLRSRASPAGLCWSPVAAELKPAWVMLESRSAWPMLFKLLGLVITCWLFLHCA